MYLIALADNSARCDYDELALAQKLGVTTRTLRKRLALLEELGYLINRKDWVEMHDDLVLTDDSLLNADLLPLSDEQFARLQHSRISGMARAMRAVRSPASRLPF
jgi:hypothetical protein